jgi:AP-2 complex subunit alpha
VDLEIEAESRNLIESRKYKEKRMGYLAMSLLSTDTRPDAYQKDLESGKETDVILSLVAISSLPNPGSLIDGVANLLKNDDASCFVRKKAALCLLSIIRKRHGQSSLQQKTDIVDEVKIEELAGMVDRFYPIDIILPLMKDPDLAVQLAAAELVIVCVQLCPDAYNRCIEYAIDNLKKIVIDRSVRVEYVYYKIAAPWLQVKLLRLLQYYPGARTRI